MSIRNIECVSKQTACGISNINTLREGNFLCSDRTVIPTKAAFHCR